MNKRVNLSLGAGCMPVIFAIICAFIAFVVGLMSITRSRFSFGLLLSGVVISLLTAAAAGAGFARADQKTDSTNAFSGPSANQLKYAVGAVSLAVLIVGVWYLIERSPSYPAIFVVPPPNSAVAE